MFPGDLFDDRGSVRGYNPALAAIRCMEEARRMYARMLWRGRWWRLWMRLRRQPHHLLLLGQMVPALQVASRHATGITAVAVRLIRGSESRIGDFDQKFNPIRTHDRERWVGVAAARLMGHSLPPVELIELGGVYFVRDGHHRVSIARALQQSELEADVVVWETARRETLVGENRPVVGMPGVGQKCQVLCPACTCQE